MDRPARRVGGQRLAPVADPAEHVEQASERRLADGDGDRRSVGTRAVAAPQARRRLERDRPRRMRIEMGLDFGDHDPAFGVENLDRSFDRRRGAVERKIENGAADRDDAAAKLPRSHRNHSLAPAFLVLHAAAGRGKQYRPRGID